MSQEKCDLILNTFLSAGDIIAKEMIEAIIRGMLLNAIATIGSASVTRFFKHEGQVGIVRSPDKFEMSAIRGGRAPPLLVTRRVTTGR